MNFVEGNLSNGEFKLLYINEEQCFIDMQNNIVTSFFEFADGLIVPYGLELCFERFDPEYHFLLSGEKAESYLLKTLHPNVDFTPIFSQTQTIETETINPRTVLDFIHQKTKQKENQNFLTALSHLSFQSGLFKLPEREPSKIFFLEKENQIGHMFEYPCISEDWFEAPLMNPFMFPPFELNFDREPYTKAWSLLISLNWDMYSRKNASGFGLLNNKISLLVSKGWIWENSNVDNI